MPKVVENLSKLEEVLSEAGWLPFPVSVGRPSGACAFFCCDYACAGFILDPDALTASQLWQPMQGTMAELRSKSQIAADKDLYLVLVVPEIRSDLVSTFQRIANDTYVCRKIILETKGRTLGEVLAEVPIFALSREAATNRYVERGSEVEPRLHRTLLEDLARRSPAVVLDRILEGAYRSEPTSDED